MAYVHNTHIVGLHLTKSLPEPRQCLSIHSNHTCEYHSNNLMGNHYNKASFLISAPSLAHSPDDTGAEVAFAGRSNAGKSSAINTITNIKSLARTSKTPGRTQQLVYFDIDADHRLVDLPGYGYAKVAERIKKQWQRHMEEYLQHRESLQGLLLVMDIRHPLTDFDRQMLAWCDYTELPVHILLTKADKLKRGAIANSLQKVKNELSQLCDHASVQSFSSLKRTGVDEARAVLDHWLGLEDKSENESDNEKSNKD